MRQSRMCVTRASLEVAVMCSGETGSYCLCHIHRQKASGEDNSVYTRGVCFLFSVANPFCCDLSPSLWLLATAGSLLLGSKGVCPEG